MKKLLVPFLAIGMAIASVTLAATPASATDLTFADFDGEFGSFSKTVAQGSYDYRIFFTAPSAGTASLSATAAKVTASTGLLFSTVSFNDMFNLTPTSTGNVQTFELSDAPALAGPNYLHLVFDGRGSVGASVDYKATGAVPEVATWAMMLVGFGAIGATMRGRRTQYTYA